MVHGTENQIVLLVVVILVNSVNQTLKNSLQYVEFGKQNRFYGYCMVVREWSRLDIAVSIGRKID